MSANSKAKVPSTISEWLDAARGRLHAAHVPSPVLDVELLLAHQLGTNRTWLHAHGDETLQGGTLQAVDQLVERRVAREPIAYITGHKEFYGREFIVTPDVLIPRPESETTIEFLKQMYHRGSPWDNGLIDVGTGSGCLGITAKLELPQLDVTLSDISPAALAVAQRNAHALQADVTIAESDLLAKFQTPSTKFSVILANLPYVDISWDRSPETNHEPSLALFADDGGLSLITTLLDQAPSALASGGYLLLEADPEQHDQIIIHANKSGLAHETTLDYIVVLRRR